MRASLPYVSDHQQKLVEHKLADIIAKTHPERVMCYGMRTEIHQSWSSFTSSAEALPATIIDLLVITSKTDKRDHESIAHMIDSLCNEEVRMVTVVHSVEAVNSGLQDGNPFIVTLFHNGILLYDRTEIPLEIPVNATKYRFARQNRLALAQSFCEMACACAGDEKFEAAMFLFHQSVELSCAELLRCRLGYRSSTHSIRKLFALSENITSEIGKLFPASTEHELKLFELLQRAYTDVRYKEDYSVSADDVFTLKERVCALLTLVAELCDEKHIAKLNASRVKEQAMALSEFESIRAATTADIVLQKGEQESIRIETEDDRETIFRFSVENRRLSLSVKNDTDEPVPYAVIHVTYKTLKGLVVEGPSNITCNETIESESFAIVQNGKGNIDLNVDVFMLDATVAKSGGLKLSGEADRAMILSTGSGDFNGADLEVSVAKITIKNTGNVSIAVEDEVTAHLFSKGLLKLKGEPRMKHVSMFDPETSGVTIWKGSARGIYL